jgi:O-antigen/teichoic acid export membrane protein
VRIRTRSFIIMLSKGLTQATTLILGIILVRLISKQTFGTYRQVSLVYMFFAGILSLQLNNSLYYFIPKLGPKLQRTLLVQTFLVTFTTALIIGAVMFFGAGVIARMFNNPDLVPLIRIFALYPFVERLVILIPAFMISVNRAYRAGAYTLVSAVGRVAVVVTMFVLGFKLSAVMWAIVLINGIIALVGCVDMLRLSPVGKWKVDRNLLMEQFQYSWPLLATAVVGTINIQWDRFLISAFFNPTTYAAYSCGAYELPIIAMVTTSISVAMMPNLVTMADQGRITDALYTWQEAARKCSFIIFPCFVFFLIFGYDFIVLLFTQDYSLASWPFRIYLCRLPIRVAVYATLFRAVGKTKPIAVGAVIALVINVIVSTTLVIIGGKSIISFIGPALGTVVASCGSLSYLLWQLTRITAVPFSQIMRWKELGLIMLICVICGVIVFIVPLPALPLIAKLSIRAVTYLVVLLIITLLTKMLKEDEKQLLFLPWNFVKRKILQSG